MSSEHTFVHENFPHLSSDEWLAVTRMVKTIGDVATAAMLTTLSEADQHKSIFAFVQSEANVAEKGAKEAQRQIALLLEQSKQAQHQLVELAAERQRSAELAAEHQRAAAAADRPRVEVLKLDVSKYRGSDSESLLRWFVELEEALLARRIEDDAMQVRFAMSNLAGRAKTWAYGKRLTNPRSFRSYAEFKHELRMAFEPPKTEFRARAEFLELRQGKRDIHAYAQHARHLVSCIVSDPVDDQTQVVTFMKGLKDGPVKTYLFREYPETMEEAISLAIQEDFSLNQAYMHSASRPRQGGTPRKYDGPEPMDLSNVETKRRGFHDKRCNRCQAIGHFAYECMAPKPVPRANGSQKIRSKGKVRFANLEASGSSKNDQDQ